LRTYELTNIEKPVTHKMRPLRSGVIVHKKRGGHKVPHQKHVKGVKSVSTPETRSIRTAQRALWRAARSPKGHKHERKPRTAKFTNIEKKPAKSTREPTAPKISKKGWYS
jgi:hypothetical protein